MKDKNNSDVSEVSEVSEIFEEEEQSSEEKISESSTEKNEEISFIKLKDNMKTEIMYAYHLSDVHIRNIQRHHEYKEVFEKVYRKLRDDIGDNHKISVIVLTGDIMHSKTELSPEAFNIAYHFFKNLSDIAPVILIPGNHDCNLSNKDRMDALSPIVNEIGNLDNIYYLKKSGIYQYYNIIFGFTSVLDDIFISADRISKEIWRGIKQKNKYKIALYHGAVHGAKTDVGYRMNTNELLAEDFNGYDYVMLGDIHKYQFLNDEKTIAYAGSLIQQTHGESLNNHGILKWDLYNNESEFIDIKNDYGFCTVKIVDGKRVDTKIPRRPRIKFVLENTNQIQYQDIVKELEQEYDITGITKEINLKTSFDNKVTAEGNLKNKMGIDQEQEKIIRTFLGKNHEDEQIDEIIKLHKEICKKVSEDDGDQIYNTNNDQKWNLLELRFSNTLCYGEDNVIDFRKYDQNTIIGIFAPNHYGKSAILDIILFCLFDKLSRGERKDILNKNKKEMYCSLLLGVGCNMYLIERSGKLTTDRKSVKIDVNFDLITYDKNGKEIKENLNGINVNETNKKIVELVGSFEDYLTTCFCLQNNFKNTNFIDMTHGQKKKYLNKLLKLNIFQQCAIIAKKKYTELTIQYRENDKHDYCGKIEELEKNIKNTECELNNLQNSLAYKIGLSEELQYIVDELANNPINTYHELSVYKLDTEEDIFKTISYIKNKLSTKTKINTGKIEEELDAMSIKLDRLNEKYDEKKMDDEIETLRKAKEDKLKKIINIPKKINNNDPEKLKQENKEIENEIKGIKNTLKEYSKDKNCNNKINRIAKLKKRISDLKKSMKIVDEAADQRLIESNNKFRENENKIIGLMDRINSDNRLLDENEKKELQYIIRTKKKFTKYIVKNIADFDGYQFGRDNNSTLVEENINYNNNLLKKYESSIKSMEKMVNNDGTKNIDIKSLLHDSKNLILEILDASSNMLIQKENKYIENKINQAETELGTLSEFSGKKTESDSLVLKIKTLEDNLNFNNEKIKEIKNNEENRESNKKIQKEITDIETKINKKMGEKDKLLSERKELENKMKAHNKIIADHKKDIDERKKILLHLKLAEEYYLAYINWCQRDESYKKWRKIKKELDNEINNLEKEIAIKNSNLGRDKKDLKESKNSQIELEKISKQVNLYHEYQDLLDENKGLPFEMLKYYLPIIQEQINQILHSLANFDIEFVFCEGTIEEEKSKKKKDKPKAKTKNVDINICYNGIKPRHVQLACGFERFIIGLAIRMTFCQISLTAKPNFIIIDEGWSCMDTENRNNVGAIMNYIKTQYEHIIIISHLEELQNEADYIVNIGKKDKFSFITTNNNAIVPKKNKKQKKKIIEV